MTDVAADRVGEALLLGRSLNALGVSKGFWARVKGSGDGLCRAQSGLVGVPQGLEGLVGVEGI